MLAALAVDFEKQASSLAPVLDAIDAESAKYRGESDNTAIMHAQARRSFCDWARGAGVQSVAQITVDALRAYADSLASTGRAAQTIKFWCGYIRRLVLDAAALGYARNIDGHLIQWAPRRNARAASPVPRPALTPDEVEAVLPVAARRGLRVLAIVRLALCGLLTVDISALKVGDVDAAGGRVRIAGRGGAEWIDVSPDAAAALRAYLASECKGAKANDSLWRARSPSWVQDQLRRALRDAGITRQGVCPGSFRATARATVRARVQ